MKIINTALTGKGGVGASTTAVNLYLELAKKHKVLMIDLDENLHTTKFFLARNNVNNHNMNLSTLKELEEIIESDITKTFDYVILDSGKYVSELNSMALQISDLIIVPTSDSESDFIQASQFVDKLIDDVITWNDYTKVKMLVNRVKYNSTKFHKELVENFKENERVGVFKTIIVENAAYKNMALSGKGASELTKNIRVHEDIKNLAIEVAG